MKRAIYPALAALLVTTACSNSAPPEAGAKEKPEASLERTSKVQSPVDIQYRIIGTPIVGQAVALDLQLTSKLGAQPYVINYRVNDETALQLPQAQSQSVTISPQAGNEPSALQVTVVPLREGRLYLNVAAVIETETGSMQTVTAIPIQVGPAAPREILENGTVTTDEDGNRIRTTTAAED